MWGILSSAAGLLRLRWKGIAVIGGILVFGLTIWQWHTDIVSRVRAMAGYEQVVQALKEQKQALEAYREETRRVRRINEKSAKKLQEIERVLAILEGSFYELEQKSEAVADWADNRAPGPLLDWLRESPADGDQSEGRADPSAQAVGRADRASPAFRALQPGSGDPSQAAKEDTRKIRGPSE